MGSFIQGNLRANRFIRIVRDKNRLEQPRVCLSIGYNTFHGNRTTG